MRDRNGLTNENLIRLPADVARVVLAHPQFRYLDCAARLRGDWVQRKSDGAKFFEVYEPSANDARQFMEFAERVAEHLLKAGEADSKQ
ncbi:hypothetical protein [Burkholderia glumae]|uniref:Uncharacterized protein n=1 Tax=Burkholderia glumae TaxID=337 RepID=A0AAQ0BVG5_BURGL|nr:hypothetical protein [Burkholderia glumae]AJY62267.1 hypothetical protein KS03_5906 [Burkholderia glumae LMG 2196 = ATCC 33617]KHJ62983.1 hypothetical protein NCPPB3923_10620 [Burkholderia glumae]MCM2485600.1 hypothetical protein [Burkholderia glumae]MCM2495995.1 hypothetical protein [Burkholderia glumae]MCM2511528.1 hypothetical protein [Burkholderia glumae]